MFDFLIDFGWSSKNIEQLKSSKKNKEKSDEIFNELIKSLNDPYKKSQAWYLRSCFDWISEEKKEEYLERAFEPLNWLSQNVLDFPIDEETEKKYIKYLEQKRKGAPSSLFYKENVVKIDINFNYLTGKKYIDFFDADKEIKTIGELKKLIEPQPIKLIQTQKETLNDLALKFILSGNETDKRNFFKYLLEISKGSLLFDEAESYCLKWNPKSKKFEMSNIEFLKKKNLNIYIPKNEKNYFDSSLNEYPLEEYKRALSLECCFMGKNFFAMVKLYLLAAQSQQQAKNYITALDYLLFVQSQLEKVKYEEGFEDFQTEFRTAQISYLDTVFQYIEKEIVDKNNFFFKYDLGVGQELTDLEEIKNKSEKIQRAINYALEILEKLKKIQFNPYDNLLMFRERMLKKYFQESLYLKDAIECTSVVNSAKEIYSNKDIVDAGYPLFAKGVVKIFTFSVVIVVGQGLKLMGPSYVKEKQKILLQLMGYDSETKMALLYYELAKFYFDNIPLALRYYKEANVICPFNELDSNLLPETLKFWGEKEFLEQCKIYLNAQRKKIKDCILNNNFYPNEFSELKEVCTLLLDIGVIEEFSAWVGRIPSAFTKPWGWGEIVLLITEDEDEITKINEWIGNKNSEEIIKSFFDGMLKYQNKESKNPFELFEKQVILFIRGKKNKNMESVNNIFETIKIHRDNAKNFDSNLYEILDKLSEKLQNIEMNENLPEIKQHLNNILFLKERKDQDQSDNNCKKIEFN